MNHSQVKQRRPNPHDSASIFSLLTFAYTGSIFKTANQKELEEDDLYEVVDKCKSSKLGSDLEQRWHKEKNKKNPKSIYRILCEMFAVRYFLIGVAQLAFKIVRSLIQPNAFANLVSYFNAEQTKFSKRDAYYNAGLVILFSILGTVFYSNAVIYVLSMGIELRTCFSGFLYRKILRLSPGALSQISFGNIVTLITKDVQAFENGIWFINDLWIGLLHNCLVCYLLYTRIGVSTFAGVLVFFGIMPIQMYLGKLLKKFKMKTCKKTDERLEETQEALSRIKIIKMYTWEDYFIDKINAARKLEINSMLAVFYIRMMIIVLGTLTSKLGLYILIMAYIWMDNPPDSSIIFFLMSNYWEIKFFFGYLIPDGIGRVSELMSAVVRLDRVLKAEEVSVRSTEIPQGVHLKPKIELDNVTIHIKEQEILKNVSMKLKPGLTVVTGSVGAGKSSFLKAMLKDFPLSNGTVSTEGIISYASQDPWLFASSIKQNILFGQEYNPKRYQKIIEVCALEYDLSHLDQGDETILIDKGLNLSKGQQARVNLARAVYRKSDIYLLDDCLTSLDSSISDFIFENLIKTFLKDKFCVLVTQTEKHLKQGDHILIVKDGKISEIVNPTEEINEDIYAAINSKSVTKVETNEDDLETSETQKLLETEQNIERKNVFKEELKKGSVPMQTYRRYLSFGGGVCMILMYFIISTFDQFASSYAEKLLTEWIDEQQTFLNIKGNISLFETNITFSGGIPKNESSLYLNLTNNFEIANAKQHKTFTWYYAMLLASIAFHIIKVYIIFEFCRRASIKIHIYLIKRIFNAVALFFDTHYIGVILNRLSQDLVNMDENLSSLLNDCFGIIYTLVGSLVLIISVDYYFIIYVGVVTLLMVFLGRIYLPFGRGMKRLEVATRSPILGHLNSTFEGLTTIRAYKAEKILINEFDKHNDLYTSSHYTLTVCQCAYGFFASCLSTFLVTLVMATFIFVETGTSAGSVGLALSQIFSIGPIINWAVTQYTDLESMMTSVERVFEYTDIENENPTGSIEKMWPKGGAISYDNVSLNYNQADIILNKLTFDVLSREKIGIVGRTGAGKSSIISTIFRLYETQGKIFIDGTDIKTIPLKYLRKNLGIIPQDPVLFSGTIRTNLDPFEQFEDDDLWKSLEKVNLKNVIPKLDMEVSTRACNFSLGQKQMICVARAILSKAKIVIMDEATANMDQKTENIINETIKNNFSDCTLLTIAHRLQSVLDCDKIMVLDRGQIKEFDKPAQLLQNTNSYFYNIVQNSK